MANIDANTLRFTSVQGLAVACEGPRAIPLILDFSSTVEYDLDMQNVVARKFISLVQAVYLDNSANGSPMSIAFAGSAQTITIGAGRQGYFMVLCPNPATISFLSAGGVICKAHLLNFPVNSHDWPAT